MAVLHLPSLLKLQPFIRATALCDDLNEPLTETSSDSARRKIGTSARHARHAARTLRPPSCRKWGLWSYEFQPRFYFAYNVRVSSTAATSLSRGLSTGGGGQK